MKVFMRDKRNTSESVAAIFLKEDGEDNEVYIKAVDSNGNEWTIASMSEEGLRLFAGIDPYTGWPLENGCIKVISIKVIT